MSRQLLSLARRSIVPAVIGAALLLPSAVHADEAYEIVVVAESGNGEVDVIQIPADMWERFGSWLPEIPEIIKPAPTPGGGDDTPDEEDEEDDPCEEIGKRIQQQAQQVNDFAMAWGGDGQTAMFANGQTTTVTKDDPSFSQSRKRGTHDLNMMLGRLDQLLTRQDDLGC